MGSRDFALSICLSWLFMERISPGSCFSNLPDVFSRLSSMSPFIAVHGLPSWPQYMVMKYPSVPVTRKWDVHFLTKPSNIAPVLNCILFSRTLEILLAFGFENVSIHPLQEGENISFKLLFFINTWDICTGAKSKQELAFVDMHPNTNYTRMDSHH